MSFTWPHVAVISSGRPGNVPKMARWLADLPEPATWYVGADEAGDYAYAGAGLAVAAGGLVAARNLALDVADVQGRPCLQLSDDLVSLGLANGPTRDQVAPLTLPEAVTVLQIALGDSGAQLAGAAPTANPYFSRNRVHPSAFIVGDLMLVAAGCPLRFNPELRLKEDYDYTCQHLAAYGKVARVDNLLAGFTHRTNKGGAVAYRTPEAEAQAIATLTRLWPAHIKPNVKRPGEVLLRWKPAQAQVLG